jgi:hypothetical protein
MNPRVIVLASLLLFAFSALPARAHEVFRFSGTIVKAQGTQLGVRTRGGRTVWMELTKSTIVLNDKTKAAPAALKPGLNVIVDAVGDDDSDVTVKRVRIVPDVRPAPVKGTARG